MEENRDQSVLKLLKARKGEWQAVSLASDVSYSWLSKFVNGHIPNPGYATLARLHKVLRQPVFPTVPAQAATESAAVEAAPMDSLRAARVRRLAERRVQSQRAQDDRRLKSGPPYQVNVTGVA